MALFKISKGKAEHLGAVGNSTALTKEGFAYFTPDDGKFYIDIRSGETPIIGNYENEMGEGGQPANRICINQRVFSYNDFDILDCGGADSEITSNTIIFDCGDSK